MVSRKIYLFSKMQRDLPLLNFSNLTCMTHGFLTMHLDHIHLDRVVKMKDIYILPHINFYIHQTWIESTPNLGFLTLRVSYTF